MDATLKADKQIIRQFMRQHYTDAKLVELLNHARSGKLSYNSCCCFVGIPTADHELYEAMQFCQDERDAAPRTHYGIVSDTKAGHAAELAFNSLGRRDAERRRRLIPIILAELKRRMREREPVCIEAVKEHDYQSA